MSPSATFERVDAASECDALVPGPAPDPVSFRRTIASGGACLGGVSDGTGHVALGARDAAGVVEWQVVAPAGGGLRTFGAAAPVLPQAEGWHGVRAEGDPERPTVRLEALAPDGSVRAEATLSPANPSLGDFAWELSEDPLGGSFVLFRLRSAAHFLMAHRFDASGARLWPVIGVEVAFDTRGSLAPFAGGASNEGPALVVRPGHFGWLIAWIERSGEQGEAGVEPWEALGGYRFDKELALAPLLDGSLALRVDGEWRRRYPLRAQAGEDAPGWLTSRAAWSFRFTRGNRGYAFMGPAGAVSADCTQRIELLAPSGRLCGRVVLREDGSDCTTGVVDQGWDGTVVQQSGKDACVYRWWPRLLGGE